MTFKGLYICISMFNWKKNISIDISDICIHIKTIVSLTL